MDAGRFENIAAPYSFHTSLRSIFIPLRLAAEMRGLALVIEIDKNIDIVARRALYEARGESPEAVEARLCTDADEDALVVGDEMRLRQITTNLASNATKFTPEGGQITIRTKLIYPAPEETHQSPDGTVVQLTEDELEMHNKRSDPLQEIVIRLEVEDTGFGIRPRDLRDNKVGNSSPCDYIY